MLHTFPLLYTKLPSTALKCRYLVTSVWMRMRTSLPLAIMNYKSIQKQIIENGTFKGNVWQGSNAC